MKADLTSVVTALFMILLVPPTTSVAELSVTESSCRIEVNTRTSPWSLLGTCTVYWEPRLAEEISIRSCQWFATDEESLTEAMQPSVPITDSQSEKNETDVSVGSCKISMAMPSGDRKFTYSVMISPGEQNLSAIFVGTNLDHAANKLASEARGRGIGIGVGIMLAILVAVAVAVVVVVVVLWKRGRISLPSSLTSCLGNGDADVYVVNPEHSPSNAANRPRELDAGHYDNLDLGQINVASVYEDISKPAQERETSPQHVDDEYPYDIA